MTIEQQRQVSPKSGYLVTLVGAWLGGFVGLFVAAWIISTAELSGADFLGAVVYGPLIAIPLGAVIGIGAALAMFKRTAPATTAVLSIPVWIVVFAALYGMWVIAAQMSRFIDSFGPAIFFFIPPLVVPLISRWIALAISRRTNRSTRSNA